MSTQKLNLTTIIDMVRVNIGELDTTVSRVDDSDDTTNYASLPAVINAVGNMLPGKLGSLMRNEGMPLPGGMLYPYFLRTVGSLTTSAGSSTVTFPADYASLISLYDNTNKAPLYLVGDVNEYHLQRLRTKPPGPPEAIELTGLSSQAWQGRVWPLTESGVTPSIEVVYYRIPAEMPNSSPTTEYPDAPPNWHMLWVYGATVEMMRQDDPSYNRYLEREREMLLELLRLSV